MTQQHHDPKLVEAVARYLWPMRPFMSGKEMAEAALDAINASGTHWVAPWEAPVPPRWLNDAIAEEWREDWRTMRDAYLSEKGDQDV